MSTNLELIGTKKRSGFTLLEMMLALGILTLVIGILLFTTQSAFQLCAKIAEVRHESQKISTLHEFLQSTFRTLPSNASMECLLDEKEGSLQPVLKLSHVASIGPDPYQTDEVQLFTQKQSDEQLNLMISTHPETAFPLLQKIEMFQWQFYNPQTQKWGPDWKNPTARPSLVELKIKTAESMTPVTMVFWIPNAR